ncbi:uncharacterized protein MKK02DRAFT_30066 [Dioszegia hungarica]|uniref:Uncharacterized protein n=1 Tax=Dioszegia hungarica TaxID=4972 RepID=A0AA38H024_9TREE|nr:uncharacterized protein MKK02DRAFT_30066 [Dioszegia hungarica]KAI9632193.1 hypothetical protein MKK02DRAFT_30066 [Dioszegia hungarica]
METTPDNLPDIANYPADKRVHRHPYLLRCLHAAIHHLYAVQLPLGGQKAENPWVMAALSPSWPPTLRQSASGFGLASNAEDAISIISLKSEQCTGINEYCEPRSNFLPSRSIGFLIAYITAASLPAFSSNLTEEVTASRTSITRQYAAGEDQADQPIRWTSLRRPRASRWARPRSGWHRYMSGEQVAGMEVQKRAMQRLHHIPHGPASDGILHHVTFFAGTGSVAFSLSYSSSRELTRPIHLH